MRTSQCSWPPSNFTIAPPPKPHITLHLLQQALLVHWDLQGRSIYEKEWHITCWHLNQDPTWFRQMKFLTSWRQGFSSFTVFRVTNCVLFGTPQLTITQRQNLIQYLFYTSNCAEGTYWLWTRNFPAGTVVITDNSPSSMCLSGCSFKAI